MPGLTKEQKQRREVIKQEREAEIKKHQGEILFRISKGEKVKTIEHEINRDKLELKRQMEVILQMEYENQIKLSTIERKTYALLDLIIKGEIK
jgi:hypothetical protein